MNSYHGPPVTLGNAAAAKVRLIVWCRECGHKVEPDPDAMAERYGAEMTVPDWRERLVCSGCGQPTGRYGRQRDGATVTIAPDRDSKFCPSQAASGQSSLTSGNWPCW